jgi:hypothetical protein
MRQSRARGTWAGAVILAVAISAALPCVSAGSTELARPYLLDGPELADGRVFFMTSWREDGYALQVAGPGARVRTVATGREAGPADYRHYSFEVAPGRIGLQASRISHEGDSGLSDPSAGVTVEYQDSRLLIGETADALVPTASCSGVGESFPYGVEGSFVAFIDDCPWSDVDPTIGSRHLRYVDFSDGAARRRAISLPRGQLIDGLQLAGGYAALAATVTNPGPPPPYDYFHIVVVDLAAGRETYRVERYVEPYVGSAAAAIDVDGTIVTVSPAAGKCEGTLAFHTPAEPEPHPLPGRACSTTLEIDGGTFLFLGESEGRPALMVGDVAGSAPRPLVLVDHALLEGFRIEGRQVVYGLATCGGATSIQLASLDEGVSRAPTGLRCPVRLASRRMRLGRDGRGAVRLRCPRGCEVSALLRLPPRPAERGRRFRSIGFAYARSRGPSAVLRFELYRRAGSRLPQGTTKARVDLVSRNLGPHDTTIRVPIRLRVQRPRPEARGLGPAGQGVECILDRRMGNRARELPPPSRH